MVILRQFLYGFGRTYNNGFSVEKDFLAEQWVNDNNVLETMEYYRDTPLCPDSWRPRGLFFWDDNFVFPTE